MRSNLENNLARNLRLLSPTHGILKYALTGTFVIPSDGPSLYFLDPGAADRTVFLPVISAQAGQQFYIANLSATKVLNVVDSDGIAVLSIPVTSTVMVMSYALGWRAMTGVGDLLNEIGLWTSHTVAAASLVIPATASEVYPNFAGAVTLTLPDVETWYATHDMFTSHLLIKDVSGAASTNNVTIDRAGADTIEGGTQLSIASDYGGWKLRRIKSATWGIVG